MAKRTPLYEAHVKAGAKIVDFGGWDMPLHYGSQIEEHHAVRNKAGLFDVSHMTVIDIKGRGSKAFLRRLLANDVERLKEKGKALYSAMLNEEAGILDDLIVYNMDDWYRVVVNCATREKDLAWMQSQIEGFAVELIERDDLAILALQGPEAEVLLKTLLSDDDQKKLEHLSVFQGAELSLGFCAKTGYTGEAGFELIIEADTAVKLWDDLLAAGVAPVGLGARDTLRLEAGMNLYGSDMDESINPFEAGMAWTLSWQDEQRDFIGKKALETLKAKTDRELVGLLLKERGVLRAHQKVIVDEGEGEITSGTFSPTLGFSIALARIPKTKQSQAKVEIRNKMFDVEIVQVPFVRHGKAVYKNK